VCLFTLGKQQTALDLRFENTVLGGQILVPQQELLIDRSCVVGEHACPNHLWLLLRSRKTDLLLSRANQETTMPDELAAEKGAGSNAVSTLSNYLAIRGGFRQLRKSSRRF
jgi:hypothetical protein